MQDNGEQITVIYSTRAQRLRRRALRGARWLGLAMIFLWLDTPIRHEAGATQ